MYLLLQFITTTQNDSSTESTMIDELQLQLRSMYMAVNNTIQSKQYKNVQFIVNKLLTSLASFNQSHATSVSTVSTFTYFDINSDIVDMSNSNRHNAIHVLN